MPDALVVSPEAPYPLAGGGAMRTASILEYLARRYTLDIILFREPGAPDPRSSFPAGMARNVHTIDLPYHSQRFHVRASRNLVRFLYGRPPLNDRFGGFQEDFSRCLAGRRYDLAVVEHFWCAPYWEQVAPHAQVYRKIEVPAAAMCRLDSGAAERVGLSSDRPLPHRGPTHHVLSGG